MVDRILDLMQKKGVNTTELAKKLGLSPSAVTDWKKGKSKPTSTQVIVMAEFFSVTTDYILLGKNTPQENNEIKNNFITGNIANGDNNHATVTITNGEKHTRELSEIESELLKISNNLNTKNKTSLLTYAYKLENEQSVTPGENNK